MKTEWIDSSKKIWKYYFLSREREREATKTNNIFNIWGESIKAFCAWWLNFNRQTSENDFLCDFLFFVVLLLCSGRPGADYPILSAVPYTNFYCDEQLYPGFFADVETRCQGLLWKLPMTTDSIKFHSFLFLLPLGWHYCGMRIIRSILYMWLNDFSLMHKTFSCLFSQILMADKRRSSVQMALSSLRPFLCVIGGLMCVAICHQSFTPSMRDCINDQKWIQPNRTG